MALPLVVPHRTNKHSATGNPAVGTGSVEIASVLEEGFLPIRRFTQSEEPYAG
jgi:hypothetical protein